MITFLVITPQKWWPG